MLFSPGGAMSADIRCRQHMRPRLPGVSRRYRVEDVEPCAAWLRYGAFRFLAGFERAVDRVAIVTMPIIIAKLNDVV